MHRPPLVVRCSPAGRSGISWERELIWLILGQMDPDGERRAVDSPHFSLAQELNSFVLGVPLGHRSGRGPARDATARQSTLGCGVRKMRRWPEHPMGGAETSADGVLST